MYLNYAEQVTIEHAELSGYGKTWASERGGLWLVHRSLLTHHAPAVYGDELELTVRVLLVQGARGVRQTTMERLPERTSVAEVVTEWVWARRSDGRPERVPRELVTRAAEVSAASLRANPRLLRDLRPG